jgi:hypothetical protein
MVNSSFLSFFILQVIQDKDKQVRVHTERDGKRELYTQRERKRARTDRPPDSFSLSFFIPSKEKRELLSTSRKRDPSPLLLEGSEGPRLTQVVLLARLGALLQVQLLRGEVVYNEKEKEIREHTTLTAVPL